MKKTTLKSRAIAVTAAALSLAALAGCVSSGSSPAAGSVASDPSSTTQSQIMGTLLLSVNPEIEIDYDDNGRVLEIEGLNEEGKAVVNGYTGYEGQPCRTVAEGLVEEIYADGYFENTVGGHTKNIVVKLEEGSRYPDDDFLEEVAEGVREAVKTCHLDSSTMTVNEDDYTENGYIGLDKAKELALGQAGLEEATFTEREYELDDGVYELEFTSNGVEYEFEVNAVTGKVTEADYDHNDDWKNYDDRDDDRYDDNDDDDDRPAATQKPTVNPTTKPTTRPVQNDDDNDDRYDDDRYETEDDDRYDDDRYESEDDDRYDDDRYESEDDDRYDDDRYESEDDDRYDDDRYESEDDDRYDDDRYESEDDDDGDDDNDDRDDDRYDEED